MKKTIYLFLVLFITSCLTSDKDKIDTYLNYKWGNDYSVFIENGCVHSEIHFDTIKDRMVGDTLIPFIRTDSTLIISQISGLIGFDQNNKIVRKSDTLITDTLFFEFWSFNGPKLLLYNKNQNNFRCYSLLENKNISIDNSKERLTFKIADYTIGDVIDRRVLNIEDGKTYNTHTLEKATLKSDEDIEFDLISDSVIFKITQKNISPSDIDSLLLVVLEKMKIQPKHMTINMGLANVTEYYRWYKKGVSITLQKTNYKDEDALRKFFEPNDWTLLYEDKIMETLMINEYRDPRPESAMINNNFIN